MQSLMDRLSGFVRARRKLVLAAWAVIAVAVLLLCAREGLLSRPVERGALRDAEQLGRAEEDRCALLPRRA